MRKNPSATEIALLFEHQLQEENVISSIFDYMEFDCSIRCFIDSKELDKRIALFYENRSTEQLIPIIALIQNAKAAASVNDKALLNEVKDYLTEHIEEPVDLEELSSRFYISYYYLCHLFKKLSGQTINQFKTAKRLEKAIRMLIKTDVKIAEIATECGFDNLSYFSETFSSRVGESPSEFRKKYAGYPLHDFYGLEDLLLITKMPSARFLPDEGCETVKDGCPYIRVHDPSDAFGQFLHEAAIFAHEGVLYASWYTCPEKELIGYTPIIGRRSYDGGKTWTEPEVIAEDKSGQILYCPPVYGVSDGKLYMLINQMVSADHMHALDLYVLDKKTDRFTLVWSRPIPFKLNTNAVTLPDGRLILPGRIAELDGFPNTPAVMISDSGKIDAEWRVVKVAEDGRLPDGAMLVHPETTLILNDNTLYLFNRNDQRRLPLVYFSRDFGETWSEATAHDIPYVNSKIYSGTLSDGRHYVITNDDRFDRSKLVLYVSEKGKLVFTRKVILTDCQKTTDTMIRCHYPAATEQNGVLSIIATASYSTENRGAVLFPIAIDEI